MPFIPNGFGQATLVFTIPGPGGPAMVTFGFVDVPASNPDTIADTIGLAWTGTGSMREMQDASCVLSEVNVLIRRGGNLVAGLDLPNIAGTLAGIGSPPQVAVLFQKLTGFAGRNRRGRMYVPGAQQFDETGTFPPAVNTTNQAKANDFMGSLQTATLDMHLLHVSPLDPPNEVIELRATPVAATQRRRIR